MNDPGDPLGRKPLDPNPAPQAAPARPKPTRVRLGKFLIQRKLGSGGFGAVYLALDESLQRTVALKTILREFMGDERMQTRFLSEARAVAKLEHPGIIRIYEMGKETGVPYFAMELIAGDDLAASAKRGIAPPRAVELLTKIAEAVGYAHSHGVIHRDLKPANIMIRDSGEPVVMDFGLAKDLDESQKGMSLTQEGDVVGTPMYMAPEQLRGDKRNVGPASDVYALGVMLYELLAGKCPFEADTSALLYMKILNEPAPRLMTANLGLPVDFEVLVERCLRKGWERRYPNGLALAGALKGVMAGNPVRQAARLLTLETAPQSVPSMPSRVDATPNNAPPTASPEKPRRSEARHARAQPDPWWKAHARTVGIILFVLLLASVYLVRRHSPVRDGSGASPSSATPPDTARSPDPKDSDAEKARRTEFDRRTFEEAVQAASALARDKKDYEGARAKLREAGRTLPPEEYSAKIEEESKKLDAWIEEQKEAEAQDAAARRAQESRKRLDALCQEVDDLAKGWDVEKAERLCLEEWPNLAPEHPAELQGLQGGLKSLEALRQRVVDYWYPILAANQQPPVDRDPRPSLEIDGKLFHLSAIDTGLVYLTPQDGGDPIKKLWKEVHIASFYDRVARPAVQAGTGDHHLALGALLLRNDALVDAEKEFQEAKNQGKDVDACLKRLDAEFAKKAGELYATEQASAKLGKTREALAVLMKLKRECGTRAFCRENAPAIDAATAQVFMEVAAGGDYFPFSDAREWSKWTPGGTGSWEIDQGVLKASGTRGTSEMKVAAVAELMLLLQFPDRKTRFAIQIGRGIEAYKMQFNSSSEKVICQGPKGPRPIPFAYETDRWYWVRIEYADQKVKFYLDEQPVDAVPAGKKPGDVTFVIEGLSGQQQARVVLDDIMIRQDK